MKEITFMTCLLFCFMFVSAQGGIKPPKKSMAASVNVIPGTGVIEVSFESESNVTVSVVDGLGKAVYKNAVNAKVGKLVVDTKCSKCSKYSVCVANKEDALVKEVTVVSKK